MTCLAIDIVGGRYGGGVVVALGIIAAALEHPEVTRLTLFVSPKEERRFDLPVSTKLEVIENRPATESTIGRISWNLGGSAKRARAEGASVLLCLSNAGVGNSNIPAVVYIQQSLPFSAEAMATMRPLERLRFLVLRSVMKRSAQRAALVGVQTQIMRSTVCDAFGLDATRVAVFAPETPPFPEADRAFGDSLADRGRPTILYVGATAGYKNTGRLLCAFEEVRRSRDARLLTVSPEPLGAGRAGVCPLGRLDRARLRAAYEIADLVVLPSLVETVGFPMLEAMTLGIPVAAADRPYAHEICGDAGTYFDPLDTEAIAAQLARDLDDAAGRQRRRALGRERMQRNTANNYAALVNASMMAAKSARTS